MNHLHYKKVEYHQSLREGQPPQIKTRGKSKCPRISKDDAERLLNAGFRQNPDADGFPRQVFVRHAEQWYKAHGAREGTEGPYCR